MCALTKDDPQTQFLLAEFNSIAEMFRTYQTNRLNIVILAVPVFGAIMINCFKESVQIQVMSTIVMYIILFSLVDICCMLMKRLRNYSIHISCIESKFDIKDGYSTLRLADVENGRDDATTKTVESIIHTLHIAVFFYVLFLIYNLKVKTVYFCDLKPFVATILLLCFGTVFVFVTVNIVRTLDTRKLPKTREAAIQQSEARKKKLNEPNPLKKNVKWFFSFKWLKKNKATAQGAANAKTAHDK